jgi:hypothetical protein
MEYVARPNYAARIVEFIRNNPGKYSFPEVMRIVTGKERVGSYVYLLGTGVIKYTNKPKVSYVFAKGKKTKRPVAVMTVTLADKGIAKLVYRNEGSLPHVIEDN